MQRFCGGEGGGEAGLRSAFPPWARVLGCEHIPSSSTEQCMGWCHTQLSTSISVSSLRRNISVFGNSCKNEEILVFYCVSGHGIWALTAVPWGDSISFLPSLFHIGWFEHCSRLWHCGCSEFQDDWSPLIEMQMVLWWVPDPFNWASLGTALWTRWRGGCS